MAERKRSFDPFRRKFVSGGPEEPVRQKVAKWLHGVMGYEHLLTEVHVDSGMRPDIVAYGDGDRTEALVVVECKRPGEPLDCHEQQLRRYAQQTGARYAMLANAPPPGRKYKEDTGAISLHYRVTAGGKLKRIEHILTFDELTKRRPSIARSVPRFRRWPYSTIASPEDARIAESAHDCDVFGVDTPAWMAPIAMELFGLLADDRKILGEVKRGDDFSFRDLGRSPHKVTNASSGEWYSKYYRAFLVKSGERELVARVAVIPQRKSGRHTHIGTAGGYTVLIVTLDDGVRDHASLELKLDWGIEPAERAFWIVHDGRTTGAGGGVKTGRVLKHVNGRAPDLVRGDTIYLGRIPALGRIDWTPDTKTLIANLIRYAILRDEVRERVARERATLKTKVPAKRKAA